MKKSFRVGLLITVLVIAAALIVALGSTAIPTSAKADDTEVINRRYESVLIRNNETLWSIASEFAPEAGLTTADYIQELKSINGLKSDKIIAGTHLIVFR